MAHKRPLDDEVVDEGSSKHQRQDGPSDKIGLCNDSFPVEGACGNSYAIGESSIGKNDVELCHKHKNGSFPVIPKEVVEDVEIDVARSASLSPWETSSTSDDDELLEEHVQLPLYPGYVSFDQPVGPVINADDVYYCLFDYPPWKRVPIGPNFQADIPCWGTQINVNISEASGKIEHAASHMHSVGIIKGGLVGICIMPFPKIESLPCYGEEVGNGRTECMCPDQGSVRCVWPHIAEGRDELRRTIGQDTFLELGFYDMGEVECRGRIVIPRGCIFQPSIVGKQAEQNRCDPFNIDSDNDEWHGSDDDGGDEGGVSDEDEEDSGIESPVHHEDLEFHKNGLHLHGDEHGLEDDGDLCDEAQENIGSNVDGLAMKSDHDSASYELHVKKSDDDDGEYDVQDGSCTSSDSGAPMQGSRLKADGCHEWNEYIIESSDAKVWDGFSMSCPTQNIDFLPTCSMIKEVFREGGFDSKSKKCEVFSIQNKDMVRC